MINRSKWRSLTISSLLALILAIWFASPIVHKFAECESTHQTDEATKHSYESYRWVGWRWICDPVSFFTFWMSLFTCGLFVATLRLWDSTERLVQGGEDTARRQLRAYLEIEAGKDSITKNSMVIFKLKVTNRGLTPAHKVAVCVGCRVLPDPTDHIFSDTIPESKAPCKLIGPRSHVVMRPSTGVISSVEGSELQAGTAKIYVWGIITYTDAFDDVWHRYFRLRTPHPESTGARALVWCDDGNEERGPQNKRT